MDDMMAALLKSLRTYGEVDIEYIAEITGEDLRGVIKALKGAIYQDPLLWHGCYYKGWVTEDEYLSGNLLYKWKVANKANKEYPGYFRDNLDALESALPIKPSMKDIYVTLGSPWIPPDVIDDFIFELFGYPDSCIMHGYSGIQLFIMGKMCTQHITEEGRWVIPEKNRYHHDRSVTRVYGTNRIEALHILEDTLNNKMVAVYDQVECPGNKSGVRRIVNRMETAAALEKQKLLIREFKDWVWKDEERRKRLYEIYLVRYGFIRKRKFDGSFLEFPDMSPDVKLYPYQRDAVARIIFSKNTLLAHDVGSGKTYEMIAAGQELIRMCRSSKNMYVVPNGIIGQWRTIFEQMYPGARLLVIDPKSFTKNKRRTVLERIRDEVFDGIIMAQSSFDMIPMSCGFYEEKKGDKAFLKRAREAAAKLGEDDPFEGIHFDELGVTRLFIDEAHNYKNVTIETKVEGVRGLSLKGAKSSDLMTDKVRSMQGEGKGVIFATGTPITNSVTECYTLMRYMMGSELDKIGLTHFDSWVGMFAERSTEFEIDVDTSSYRLATRFARFHNLPELTALISQFADFHQIEASDGIPDHDGYEDTLIPRSPEFEIYLRGISARADAVRSGLVPKTDDNMLKITTDGRKAALDMRLADPDAPYDPASKVSECARKIAEIYEKTAKNKLTQLIFCDTSTPKKEFNMYDELKRLLIEQGIPEEQIAYIHNYECIGDNTAGKERLFEQVRKGEIRILMGSTAKLGLGVNVQDRLIALHHLDIPWRPSDMTQREGRILRQGNTSDKVYIYRYITEGSFDAYSWQLLETKQRFISDLLSGSVTARSGSDVEDVVLDYAEVKALAVGNPLVKERVEASNELTRLLMLQRKLEDQRAQMRMELKLLPERIARQENLIALCGKDIEFCLNGGVAPDTGEGKTKKQMAEERKELRELITDSVMTYALEKVEKTLTNYRGFDIVLPADMKPDKPFVYIRKNGRYLLDLGDNDVGNLVRIDNFIDSLEDYRTHLEDVLASLHKKQSELESELAKKDDYKPQIKEYQAKVRELDMRLVAGVMQ